MTLSLSHFVFKCTNPFLFLHLCFFRSFMHFVLRHLYFGIWDTLDELHHLTWHNRTFSLLNDPPPPILSCSRCRVLSEKPTACSFFSLFVSHHTQSLAPSSTHFILPRLGHPHRVSSHGIYTNFASHFTGARSTFL